MDRVRILAISDSFGAANGLLNKDETWAKELEDQLNKIEDRYEVILLAQGGAGYKDYLRWVEDGYIEEIDPDVVLISFFNNDFNLLHDFEQKFFTEDGQLIYNKLDKELGFYLKCFEKEDDFFGRSLKKAYNIFPNLYRFYKFSSCGEEISRVDSNILIDESGVVANYRRIDSLINVPTFLYQIESKLGWDQGNIKRAILTEIQKNGIRIINKADSQGSNINEKCGDIFRYGYRNCEAFKANTFDGHFNRYYNKMHVEGKIKEIKESIDSALVNIEYKESRNEIINNSDSIIVDYLPNTLFVSNPSYEKSYVGFFRDKSYGYGRSSDNFCVPFDRKGVIINFNRYLTEGREIKISSEFQGAGLGLVSRGYDEQGKVVYGNAIELKPGSPVSFLGSESVRGLVVLSNNKNCDSKNLDNSDEFLLEVELI
jgi:hypothetical protein